MSEFLLTNTFWIGLMTLSAFGLAWTFAREAKLALPPQQAVLQVEREGGVFLDVRPPSDFSAGHVPGARNVPVEELGAKAASIDRYKKKPVVVVCQNGSQSKKAVKQLQADGFAQALILAGGLNAWINDQFPLQGKKKKEKA